MEVTSEGHCIFLTVLIISTFSVSGLSLSRIVWNNNWHKQIVSCHYDNTSSVHVGNPGSLLVRFQTTLSRSLSASLLQK